MVQPLTQVRLAAIFAVFFAGRAARGADQLVALEPQLGVGAPLGWAGAALVLRPIEELAMHGGAGLGTNGPQVALGARWLAPVSTRFAVGGGAAWSFGPHGTVNAHGPWTDAYLPEIDYWPRAHILNLEASLTARHTRWAPRAFLGAGYVLNGGDAVCINVVGGCGSLARVIPYLGAAFAFGII